MGLPGANFFDDKVLVRGKAEKQAESLIVSNNRANSTILYF